MRHRWVAGIVLIAGCVDVSGLGFDFGPIAYVDVFPPQATVHVGDTTRMSAYGVNKVGTLTHLTATRAWQVSDTMLAVVRPFASRGDSAVLIARRPGAVRVEVRMEGVLGASQVTIVP
jgi:hypothetical protein